jgi:hypothetical protein
LIAVFIPFLLASGAWAASPCQDYLLANKTYMWWNTQKISTHIAQSHEVLHEFERRADLLERYAGLPYAFEFTGDASADARTLDRFAFRALLERYASNQWFLNWVKTENERIKYLYLMQKTLLTQADLYFRVQIEYKNAMAKSADRDERRRFLIWHDDVEHDRQRLLDEIQCLNMAEPEPYPLNAALFSALEELFADFIEARLRGRTLEARRILDQSAAYFPRSRQYLTQHYMKIHAGAWISTLQQLQRFKISYENADIYFLTEMTLH